MAALAMIGAAVLAFAVDRAPASAATPSPNCASPLAKLDGTFIEPTLYAGWDDAHWRAEYADMQASCMTTAVIRYSADVSLKTTYYPSRISGMSTAFDLLTPAFHDAPAGMGIYVGLQVDDPGWFSKHADDPSYLWRQEQTAEALAADILARYGTDPAWTAHFKGWYLTFELDNGSYHQTVPAPANPGCPTASTWAPQASWQNLVGCFFSPLTTTLRKTMSATQRIITAPMFFTGSPWIQTTTQWTQMWGYLLAYSKIDTLAPQDGVGAEHATTADLAPWYQASALAVAAVRAMTGRDVQLWDDPESYLHNQSMPIRLLTDDMKAVQPYLTGPNGAACGVAPASRCGTYIGFQYLHQSRLEAPLYYAAYQNYLGPGLSTTPPTAPTNIQAGWADPVTISLSWTPSTDADGVAGYNVYRVAGSGTPGAGDRIATLFTPITAPNACGTNPCLTDTQLDPGATYTYRIEAFDATGNVASSLASASTPALNLGGTNLALRRPYTASLAAHTAYPDTGKTELTDGAYGSTTDWSAAAWQGRATADPYSFTIDLGQVTTIGTITSDWMQQQGVGIYLPKQIAYSVSSDGSTWTKVATTPSPLVNEHQNITRKYRAVNLSASGRYLRLDVTPFINAWSFVDEVEVYAPSGAPIVTNKAQGRTYQATMAADPSYPDTGMTELTDGGFGSTNFTEAAWQGRKTASTYSFTLDLGSGRSLSSLSSDWLQVNSAGIYLPTQVAYSTSADGVTFAAAGTVAKPAVSTSDQSVKFTLATPVTARYVRVTVQPMSTAWWTFTDEIQAM